MLGYFFKKIKFPDESFWKHLDKFNYFVLFPTLLFYKLSTANVEGILNFDFVIIMGSILIAVSLLLVVINKMMKFNNDSFTSIYQGSIRFNTYVFLALTQALLDEKSFIMGIVLITFLIPLINILCIAIFASYVPKNKLSIISIFKSIITNPLIVACFLGASVNILGISFPILIENTLQILSVAALPLGLLSVGVGLHISSIGQAKLSVALSSFVKLVFLPILVYVVCIFFEVENDRIILLTLFASMPTASSAYALARELGGDLKLISSIVSLQTILSIITISVIIWILNG